MRKLIIGRHNSCDIVIPDTTDRVSRRHAILTFSPLGRMMLYDASTNGTFVDGKRIAKGGGMRVTRSNQINLAHTADLDWNTIHDPYRRDRLLCALIVTALVFVLSLLVYKAYQHRVPAQQPERGSIQTTITQDSDTIAKEAYTPRVRKKHLSPKKKKNVRRKSIRKEYHIHLIDTIEIDKSYY